MPVVVREVCPEPKDSTYVDVNAYNDLGQLQTIESAEVVGLVTANTMTMTGQGQITCPTTSSFGELLFAGAATAKIYSSAIGANTRYIQVCRLGVSSAGTGMLSVPPASILCATDTAAVTIKDAVNTTCTSTSALPGSLASTDYIYLYGLASTSILDDTWISLNNNKFYAVTVTGASTFTVVFTGGSLTTVGTLRFSWKVGKAIINSSDAGEDGLVLWRVINS
jgi:hypothetical protein